LRKPKEGEKENQREKIEINKIFKNYRNKKQEIKIRKEYNFYLKKQEKETRKQKN
jgi:hypothetical protein